MGVKGIHQIPDANIRADPVHGDDGVHGEGYVVGPEAVDRGAARGLLVLPDAEVAVDEGVVQEEGRVAGGGVHVGHDGADTVVSPGMGTALSTSGHVGESVAVLAGLDHGGAGVTGLGGVAVAGETVAHVSGARADVEG